MRLFLTILEGNSPEVARPILATEDQDIINTVREKIVSRLTRPKSSHDSRNPKCEADPTEK